MSQRWRQMSHHQPTETTRAWLELSDYTTYMSTHPVRSGTAVLPVCTSLLSVCAKTHGRQRTCSTPCSRSQVDIQDEKKPLSRTAPLPHQDDRVALIIPNTRWYERFGEKLSVRPVVGRQRRHPQILCHCAGASMRRRANVSSAGQWFVSGFLTDSGLRIWRWFFFFFSPAAVQWMEIAGSTQHATQC